MTGALPIASFKIQFFARRVRIVPVCGEGGEPFAEPGIDLVGDEVSEAFELSKPIRAWLEERQPDEIRALSFDVLQEMLLVTFEGTPRPRAIRIDRSSEPAASAELLRRAAPLMAYLGSMSREKLNGRRRETKCG